MNSKNISIGILKAIAIIAGILILGLFLYKIRSVFVYITIAFVVSLMGRPIALFLKRKLKFKNTLAAIFTMTIFFGLFFSIMAMFVPLVIEQGENLSLLNMEGLKLQLQSLYNQANAYLTSHNIDLLETIEQLELGSTLSFNAIPNLLNSIIGTLGSFSIGLFSVVFITFFFLKDKALFKTSIMAFVNDNYEERLQNSLSKIRNLLTRYFIGLLFQIFILFIIYTIILLFFKIENAVVIAFLCALLNLIPYIGPLIGGFVMLILSMTSNLDLDFQTQILPITTKVMIGYAFAQALDNLVLQPNIFANRVRSHPLEVFLVIIISGLLFGVVGLIVAIPSYTALKVIAQEFLSEYKFVKKLTRNL